MLDLPNVNDANSANDLSDLLDDLSRRALTIYEEKLKPLLEPEHDGKTVEQGAQFDQLPLRALGAKRPRVRRIVSIRESPMGSTRP